ncbi:aconitate hydratase [Blattabacterium cuenoti]|uniref:aconitate hydratase n=1 Tax=Blattabacterium cuenoti TaxID=1653831 RepID=UPI00163C61F4|nr:aconitate hydratase [Blattabacterium cuenoti]
MIFDFHIVKKFYSKFEFLIRKVRSFIHSPMTYSEKILYSHLFDINILKNKKKHSIKKSSCYMDFLPDRIALQDATAQMTILQFMQTEKRKTIVPTTIHCDHLISAKYGNNRDLSFSIKQNKEIYNFLQLSSKKYGIGFWNPGSGIIHQVILENYAFPGGMMIGTDSHTPNAGGLGMLAIGVGGSDAAEVMSGYFLELKIPKIIGVHLKGKLSGWVSPKDVILKLSGMMGVMGGKNAIIEYFGEGTKSIHCTGKATICNMGAEIGATASIFPYDINMKNYLDNHGRRKISVMSENIKYSLIADKEVYLNPSHYYHKVIEIDLSNLEPHINGPFTPDKSTPISKMKEEYKKYKWPRKISVGLIGSCTNSSYEDLSRAISIIIQAKKKKLKIKSKYLISPGSKRVLFLLKKKGILHYFDCIGGKILSNACGPCIGQWDRTDNIKKVKNTIIHSFNRNFSSRNDGNPKTYAFIASPEIVTALVLSGDITFDPRKDLIINENGESVKLEEPKYEEFDSSLQINPKKLGYLMKDDLDDNEKINVLVKENSERLQLLKPFNPWNGKNFLHVRLLIKVQGKCTTDHISMAGPWLKYRGNLSKISENLLIGSLNSFNGEKNKIKNIITNCYDSVYNVAKFYKNRKISTVIIGEENYGEGSSREHAAMEPRFLGVCVVLVKSFARIHENNLKKQGILALTFSEYDDYEKIQENDIFNFYIKNIIPDKDIKVDIIHFNGCKDHIIVKHSYNRRQIEWFKAGSSLNFIKKKFHYDK